MQRLAHASSYSEAVFALVIVAIFELRVILLKVLINRDYSLIVKKKFNTRKLKFFSLKSNEVGM